MLEYIGNKMIVETLSEQKLINRIDPSLDFIEELGCGSSDHVYKVEKKGALYLLKITDDTWSWGHTHMDNEIRALKMAWKVKGITHLIEEYGVIESRYSAILKEYLEGDDLDHCGRKIANPKLKKQLMKTLKQLHDLGMSVTDLHSGNIVISSDESQAKIIDLGCCRFHDRCSKSEFKFNKEEDIKDLESYFI